MKYTYKALNDVGDESKGFITADSTIDAENKLKEKGLFPTELYTDEEGEEGAEGGGKSPWHAHVIAGWPLILIFIGGMIGGFCGGCAYGVSMYIINRRGPSFISYTIAFFIGVAGVVAYFGIVIALVIAFPDIIK